MANPKPMVMVTKDELVGLIKSANAKEPSGVEKMILWATKWSPSELKKITDAIGMVQNIISAFGAVGAALATAKGLLETIGILEAADPFKDLRVQIDELRMELRQGLDKIEDKDRVDKRVEWASAMETAAVALSNLHNSPGSLDYQGKVKEALKLVRDALFAMLYTHDVPELHAPEPVAGDIAFFQKGYGWPPPGYSDPPAHWVPYASSPGMRRAVADPSQQTINFWEVNWDADEPEERANKQDLKARIWDPSYYLDLVTTGVSYYLTLLAVIEPAYRATGHNRFELGNLSKGLKNLVTTWRNSLLITNVDYYLSPFAYQDRSSPYHPYTNPYDPGNTRGIPLGVVDPISGLMYFNPVWNEGFEFEKHPLLGNTGVVTNTSAAAAIARNAIKSGLAALEDSSGITALSRVQKELEELTEYGLNGSMFSRPGPVRTLGVDNTLHAFEPLVQLAPEMAPEALQLGAFGAEAVKPLKQQYKADRIFDPRGKYFRLPMVRRMLVSEIQLGYRLTFTIAGSAQSKSVDLAVYTSPGLQGHNANHLPPAPAPFPLTAADATVYDVVQAGHYSPEDEERFEEGRSSFAGQRLFLNPRSAPVAVQVGIDFELDLNDPSLPYIAFAKVRFTNLDPNPSGAFIIHVAAYETANTAVRTWFVPHGEPELIEEVKEISAGYATVHFIPTYLVVEPRYFEDRAVRLAVIDKSILDVMQLPDIGGLRGGGRPEWRNRDFTMQTAHTLRTFEQLAKREPERMAAAAARFQPPAIIRRGS